MKKLLVWAERKVTSPYALPIFSLLVFIEPFFFMPVTELYILYGIMRPKNAFNLAAIATISSILGAMVAYGIGLLLWNVGLQNALYWLISPERFQECATTYRCCAVSAVFWGSFIPFIPFKAFTLTAGFCQLPLMPFILSVAAARALRFFGLATALYFFGDKIQHIVDRYFYIIVTLMVAASLLGLIWFLYH
jgi:membrane protein YqaA with SNARE-associated domain